MEELVKSIAIALVDNPDEVEVTVVETDSSVNLELRVAQGDMGKVIGRQGRIAKAVRTVVRSAASGTHKRINIDIV